MNLKINKAEALGIFPSSGQHFEVNVQGIEVEELLNQIDIIVAIDYYGITELLDTIGIQHLKLHLESL